MILTDNLNITVFFLQCLRMLTLSMNCWRRNTSWNINVHQL